MVGFGLRIVVSDEAMSHASDTLPISFIPKQAACRFQTSGNPEHLAEVVLNVIERHIDSDLRPRLRACGGSELRFAEDLAVDSLTMMEIGLLAEDALQITIGYDELSSLRTVGDMQRFIAEKVRG